MTQLSLVKNGDNNINLLHEMVLRHESISVYKALNSALYIVGSYVFALYRQK